MRDVKDAVHGPDPACSTSNTPCPTQELTRMQVPDQMKQALHAVHIPGPVCMQCSPGHSSRSCVHTGSRMLGRGVEKKQNQAYGPTLKGPDEFDAHFRSILCGQEFRTLPFLYETKEFTSKLRKRSKSTAYHTYTCLSRTGVSNLGPVAGSHLQTWAFGSVQLFSLYCHRDKRQQSWGLNTHPPLT